MRELTSNLPDDIGDMLNPFWPWHVDLELVLIVVVAVVLARRFPAKFGFHGVAPILRLLLAAVLTWTAYTLVYLLIVWSI